MGMKEAEQVRQIEGEPGRRWFFSDYFDLIVWQDESGKIIGFQLCYDKGQSERALTWKASSGYAYNAVDDGENRPGMYKATPILVADGVFNKDEIAATFSRESGSIEKEIAAFVHEKLLEYA